MRQLRYFLIGCVAFISLSSNITRTPNPSDGIYPGDLFSDIKNMENVSGTKINLSDLKGQKVLVNFWAAYNALSRMDNTLIAGVIERNGSSLQLVSVCFDKSRSVFERTIAFDKVDGNRQFWVDEATRGNLFDTYRLEKGFKNYLLDEKGKIIATDLSPEKLDQFLKKN